MGRQAVRIFDDAERFGGLRAKIALAVLTRVSSTEAAGAPDTPELLARLTNGLTQVRTSHGTATRSDPPPAPPRFDMSVRALSGEEALRRQQRAYLDLMTQRSLLLGDVETTFRRITESASAAIDAERVSVWLVDSRVTKISCADLYERTKQAHSSGVELGASAYQPYFTALATQRTIAAHDAHTDPRTACFSQSYLAPLGIGAMLDVPIWLGDAMVGVICHEHVGPARRWTDDEEAFAYLMSSFVSLAMERGRAQAQAR